jgi:DNA-binding transcriptional MerR regulator
MATTKPAPTPTAPAPPPERLLRIQEAAGEVGLTARSVRYYEELGLLRPAGRSEGDYRLFDESDLERLRFIKGLRDEAGFSLAEIAQLLDDEEARQRDREAYDATLDLDERRRILLARIEAYERQTATLQAKIDRLRAMVEQARDRRDCSLQMLAELEPEVGEARR